MSDENIIYLLDRSVTLRQSAQGFRSGLDSVMLAAACPVQDGQSVLDLGCGVGGASFCLLYRVGGAALTGVDIQDDHVAIAQENAAQNEMAERSIFLHDDIRNFAKTDHFDHVICNPPYLEAGAHLPSPSSSKATAHGHLEEDFDVQDWVDAAHRNLKNGSVMTMIHRADQCDKIIKAMGKRFGGVEIIPLWPKVGVPAKRVIVRAIKNRKSPATLHPGLVLHEENGDYTPAAESILRAAAAL